MSEEALQAIWQAKLLIEGINDSFGAKISEDILDKMVLELQKFDEAGQNNRVVCADLWFPVSSLLIWIIRSIAPDPLIFLSMVKRLLF